MTTFFRSTFLAAIAFLAVPIAQATMITSATNVDNAYHIYLSTDDSTAGTEFGSGSHWPTTFVDSATLTPGVTNYLHILANDLGGIAMMLGEFTLSDSDFAFANGTQEMLSGDAGLLVSLIGFGSAYSATTDLGANGTSPWGMRGGVDSAARYVWSSDAHGHNEVYFSAAIYSSASQVPEPTTVALMLIGIAGFGLNRRRKALAKK